MTPAGIEPESFRFVAQHLNHCATTVSYLGTFINSNYVIGEERKPMFAICDRCLHSLGQIFRSGFMSKAGRIKVYETIRQPVVLNGRETCPMTEMYMKRLNA